MVRILKAVDRGIDKLISATGVVAIVIMLLLACLVLVLTVSRWVFRTNIPGMFDGAVYSLIVFPFLTVAYTLRQGHHISVDMLTGGLAKRTQTILSVAVYSVSLIYVTVLGWQGWRWTAHLFQYKALTSGVFEIPKGILASTIVFGCFLLTLQIVRLLVQRLRSVPSQTASPGLRHNPWLWVSLFITGTIVSILLFVYVNSSAGIILLALFLLFSGMPVFLALGLIGVLGIYFLLGSDSFLQMPITAYKSMSSFPLTCLPLFILGGLIMEGSGVAEDIFRFFQMWAGRWSISTPVVTIGVGLVFCAISGSSTATTAVVAAVALPVLFGGGFSKALCCGLVGGATVGSLIPPSLGYVVYAVLTDESVGALFMATILPGVLLFVFYFLYILGLAKFSKKSLYENGQIPSQTHYQQATWKEKFLGFKTAAWGLLTPVLIIGGIYLGIYTPTEAAGVLVVYGIIVSVFIKKVKWQAILKATMRSAEVSSMLLCIIFSAFIFALVISQMEVAASLEAYAKATGMTPLTLIMIIFVVLTILGLFLDAAAMKVITLPVLYPLAMSLGINNLWLGVLYQFMMEIGMLTPPVGLNLFIMKGVTGLPMNTVARGCMPFLFMMVLVLVIMYIFPELVTWLPSTMPR